MQRKRSSLQTSPTSQQEASGRESGRLLAGSEGRLVEFVHDQKQAVLGNSLLNCAIHVWIRSSLLRQPCRRTGMRDSQPFAAMKSFELRR